MAEPEAQSSTNPESSNGFPVVSFLEIEGRVLSGEEFEEYCKDHGLCRRCANVRTHRRVIKLFGRGKKWEPMTLHDEETGEYSVYKGYCLKPNCYTLGQAKRLTGEAGTKDSRDKRRKKLKMKMLRKSDKNRPERRKTRADPETGSIMSTMDDDMSIMSGMSDLSGISSASGRSSRSSRSGLSGIASTFRKKKRRGSGFSLTDSVSSFTDFSDDDTIDTTQTPMPLKPVVPGEVNPIISQRLEQLVKHDYFAVLDMTKVELRPEDVDAIVAAMGQTKTLDTIVLNKCRLRDDGLIKIANALEQANHINIRSFSCRQNRIGNKGVTALSFLFSKSETLETLDLSENSISSKGAANILSAFSSNPKPVLSNLNLSQNEIWDMDDGSFLRSNTTLKIFNLDGNFMHDEGAEQIANAIAANKQSVIEKLYLGWNGISDDGAIALARMMEANETLQVLGLAENDISNTGARAILSALAINTSVREISGLYHNQIDRKFIIVAIKRLLHRYGERTGQAPPTEQAADEGETSDHSVGWAQQIYSDERHFDEKEEEQDQGPSIALEAIEHWDWGTFGIEEIEASRSPPSAVMPDVPDRVPSPAVEPEATKEVEPEELVEVAPNLPIDRLTVFQSAPLAYFDRKTSEHIAIPIFDFQYEADAIEDALANPEALGGVIELNVENVTAGRFKVSFLQGTSPIMHFSGIGHDSCLALENGFGYMQALPTTDLMRFVKNGEGKVKVVVVHTCYARAMADAFIEAGVPHVVCLQRDTAFRDEGPVEFAQAFYTALASHKTLQQAFNEGVDTVKRSSNVKVTGNIAQQYCLLPEKPANDPYHNVDVFYQRPMPKLSPPPEVFSPPLPEVPEHFVGREVDMYEVLESLRVDDVVRVGGAVGCGKASCISAVARYILERPKSFKIDSVYWLPAPESAEKEEDEIYEDLCFLIEMTINSEDQIWEEPEFAQRRDRVTSALADMRSILVIDGRMFTTEASGENLEMILTHLLNEVSMKIVLITAMEASKSSKTKTSRQEETMVNIGPLDLKSSALLFGNLSEVISRSGNPIVHTAEEFADCIVPPSIAKIASSDEKQKLESNRSNKLYEILGGGNPTEIAKSASAFTEIDLRNLLRFAKRPEIQVDSGAALEEEILKYTTLKKKAIDGKNYARAYDFTDAIEELEGLRPKFPNVEDLAKKEAEYKEKFKKYLKMKKYNEANAIKRKILELKKTALREKHAKAEDAKNAVALTNGDSNGKKNFYEIDKLFSQLRLDQPITAMDVSGTLSDNSGEATLKIPRVGGFCNLNITMGSVFDLAYEDGTSGIVYWTNECCDMAVDDDGKKILEAGGESFQTAMQSLDVQATTDWGPVKCPTGEAVGIGPLSFSTLQAKFVFLAVGPLSPSNDDTEWDDSDLNGIQILETEIRASYRSSLQLIAQTGVNDVGIPTLTSNPTGNAYERTLWIGLKTIVEEAKSTELRSIDLCTASHQEANLLLKMALALGLSV
ncbi:unnamed protein product [Cylindrotheca closterium]|uniref:NACHT domain-containing protein n=1 Tax=Cylindrotheca closterium TaxID=2856 RepID=A0AAD2FWN9_9STRA|nr:unnamed protein product [Cylindrotheca closterium]